MQLEYRTYHQAQFMGNIRDIRQYCTAELTNGRGVIMTRVVKEGDWKPLLGHQPYSTRQIAQSILDRIAVCEGFLYLINNTAVVARDEVSLPFLRLSSGMVS